METTRTCPSSMNIITPGARSQAIRGHGPATRQRRNALLAAQENVRLDPRRGLALQNAAGMEITCLSGCLWLTMEGDSRDIMLAAGDAFTIERNGLTLISSPAPSLVNLRAQWESSYGRWPRWLQAVAGWLVRVGEARARRHRLSRYY